MRPFNLLFVFFRLRLGGVRCGRRWGRSLVYVGSALHLANERLRGVLHLAHDAPGLPHEAGQFFLAKYEQCEDAKDRHIGEREHDLTFSPPARVACARAAEP